MNVQKGDTVTVKVRAQNPSLVDTTGEVTVSMYEGDVATGRVIGTVKVPSIAHNSYADISIPWKIGYDASGNPIANYQDSYKVVSASVQYTLPQPEVTLGNNVATGFIIVGNPQEGTYGMSLTTDWSTSTLTAGNVVTLSGTAAYNWGSRMPVMGASVTVKLSNGDTYNTLTTAPAGRFAVAIPLPKDPGDYTATVMVFDHSLVGKQTISIPITTPPQFTDVVVSNIGFTGIGLYNPNGTEYVIAGSTLSVRATIYNQGNLPATGFDVAFYDGDPAGRAPLGTKHVDSLPQWSGIEVTCPKDWLPTGIGNQTIYVVADVSNAVPESNELNNVGTRGIGVRTLLPDLRPFTMTPQQVSGINFSAEPVLGETITISTDIYNNGPKSLADGSSFNVSFYDGDPAGPGAVPLGTQTVTGSIPVGGKVVSSIPWDTSKAAVSTGLHRIFVKVDPANVIEEDFEDNNTTDKSLMVYSTAADLWPIGLSFSNSAPQQNSPVTLTATIQNLGAAASASLPVEFFIGDPDNSGVKIDNIDGGTTTSGILPGRGAQRSLSINWTAPGSVGTVFIYVRVAGHKFVQPLTVYRTPPPDLRVLSENISYTPAIPNNGDTVIVRATVTNASATQAATDFLVAFSLDTPSGYVSLGTAGPISLGPLGSTVVTAPASFAATTSLYAIKVEAISAQGDGNIADNTATTSFGVFAPTSTWLSLAPVATTYGESVTLTATVTSPLGTPTGAITFMDGALLVGSASLSGGVGTLTTSSLVAGSHNIVASYAGYNGYLPSDSQPVSQSVAQASQIIGPVSCTPATLTVGSVCTVSATGGASGTPVTFRPQTPGICTVCGTIVSGLAVGTCIIEANQRGNANYKDALSVTGQIPVTSQPHFAVTVIKSGTGTGSVTSDSGIIDWIGSIGSATYNSGAVVRFTAAADPGSSFSGWSGACTGTGICQVTVDAAKSVTAVFTDATIPVVTITDKPLQHSNSSTGTISFNSNEQIVSFQCSKDSGAFTACNSPYTYTLTNGQHTFTVKATDASGNWSSATYSWEVNTALPSSSEVQLPRSGQGSCFDSSGAVIDCVTAGQTQDGAIRAGVPWPTPRFTDNHDGTATDSLTGLIWLKDANCIHDTTWDSALAAAKNLANGSCSLSDGSRAGQWRLPNINELKSIVDRSQQSPALPAGNPFKNTGTLYWSSTSRAVDPTNSAWILNMEDGHQFMSFKTQNSIGCWPVRDSQ